MKTVLNFEAAIEEKRNKILKNEGIIPKVIAHTLSQQKDLYQQNVSLFSQLYHGLFVALLFLPIPCPINDS